MRTYLFEKANYLLKDIKIIARTDHSIRLLVGKFEVELKYKKQELIWWCSCKHMITNKLCSHSIAAMAYLTNVIRKTETGIKGNG